MVKNLFNLLCMFVIFVCIGCSSATDEVYAPSIASLKANDILVMKYSSCHNGCIKGTVKFRNSEASIGGNDLVLTAQEIAELDSYFLKGVDDEWLCSIVVEISFKHKKRFRTLNSKDVQIYPCSFFREDFLTPEQLVSHLKWEPNEVPYWRLSPEEQSKKESPSYPH